MAQTPIITPGSTVAPSDTVVVPQGESLTFGLYVASGELPRDVLAHIEVITPGAPVPLGRLTRWDSQRQVAGPVRVRVTRHNTSGVAVGVYTDDGA